MIQTENYILKKMNLGYVNKSYMSWFNNSEIINYIGFNPKNLNELKQDVETRIKDKNSLFLAILTKSKKHIGNILIHKINKNNRSAFLGILVGNKNYRNKKVGSETLKYLTVWLNKYLNIKSIYLGVSENNKRAIRLYSKVGFEIYAKKSGSFFMCYNHIKNKFILGTAQFGLNYGITNKNDKPIEKNLIKNIYNYCNKTGLNHLDTASNYNFNFKLLPKCKWIIDTKITINKDNTKFTSLNKIFAEFNQNKNLTLNTVYIHNPDKIFTNDGISIMKMLESYKNKKFKNIGISVYDLKNIKKILNNFQIDVIQLPYNIIDRRFDKIFKYLKKKKIKIIVRSIFLQGTLIDNKHLLNKEKVFKNFKAFSKKKGRNRLDLCVDFIKKNNFIDKMIFGVHNINHFKQITNSNILKNINYPSKLISKETKIIDPRKWYLQKNAH
jgi:aryl-alcohol dehydrogenase-like predicted oxidoreductase/RimJ/RimL family protein N-acetyltransferase